MLCCEYKDLSSILSPKLQKNLNSLIQFLSTVAQAPKMASRREKPPFPRRGPLRLGSAPALPGPTWAGERGSLGQVWREPACVLSPSEVCRRSRAAILAISHSCSSCALDPRADLVTLFGGWRGGVDTVTVAPTMCKSPEGQA